MRYDGCLSAVALVDPHPALKVSSPQAPMTDTWMGDDFFHNGAWRQTYGHEYVKSMESGRNPPDISFDIDASSIGQPCLPQQGARLLEGRNKALFPFF